MNICQPKIYLYHIYVHKINSSSCLGFMFNKQQFEDKSVAGKYIYLMDRSSPEKSLATITVNGLVCLVARIGYESASAAYSVFTDSLLFFICIQMGDNERSTS
jgi:hypothetical protein